MDFWATVLAVVVGILVWDILHAVVMALLKWIPERTKHKRRIGFDGGENSRKTANGAQMRKIGFGAND